MTTIILAEALVVLLVVVALVVAALRDVLAATIVFAAYSLGMAILWTVLQAPDVALTEAAVGAGVTTSLFLVAIIKTGRPATDNPVGTNIRSGSVVVVLGVVAVLLATLPALPAVGDAAIPPFQRVVPHYLAESVPQLGIENVVTAILAGFRAFDTLGEVTVVFAAGVATLVVFSKEVL